MTDDKLAEALLRKIAAVEIWQDVYPDGPDILSGGLSLTPADVRTAREALASLAFPITGDAGEAPDGWKLVPVEPTEDMLNAGDAAMRFVVEPGWHSKSPVHAAREHAARVYEHMLAASPSPIPPERVREMAPTRAENEGEWPLGPEWDDGSPDYNG